MKVLATITALLLVFSVSAQEQEGVKSEGAHQAEYNSDAQDRDNSGQIDSRVQPSEDREGFAFDREEHDPDQAANTSGVTHRTTSSSGSPAILMTTEDVPDGTNNMQRASLNIAGSPVPGGASNISQTTEGDVRSDARKSDGELHTEIPGATVVKDRAARDAESTKKSGKKKKK